ARALSSLEEARAIRTRLLRTFEHAEATVDEDEQRRLLTVVVVGGGPTGVELAGAIAELSRHALSHEFRRIDPTRARIVLVEAGPRLLPHMPEDLSAYARRALEKLGVEVRLNCPVEAIDAEGVVLAGQRLQARTVLWGAGVAASPAAEWLGVDAAPGGRVEVAADLAVPGLDGVYAI